MPNLEKNLIYCLALLLAVCSSSAWAEHSTPVEKAPQRLQAPTVCPPRSTLDRYLGFFDRLLQEAKLAQERADRSKAKELEAKVEELTKLNAGLEQKIEEATQCERNLRSDLATEKSIVAFYKREQEKRKLELLELEKFKLNPLSTEQFFTDLAQAVDVGYWSNPGAPFIKNVKTAQTVLNKYPAWWVLSKLKDIPEGIRTSEEHKNVLRAFFLYHSAFRIARGAPDADGNAVQIDEYQTVPVNLEVARYTWHTERTVYTLQNKYSTSVYDPHYERLEYEDSIVSQSRHIRWMMMESGDILVAIDDPSVKSGIGLTGSGDFARVVKYPPFFPADKKPNRVQIQLQKQDGGPSEKWVWDKKAPPLELAIP